MYTEWTSMDTFLKSAENDGFLYVALTMANWPNQLLPRWEYLIFWDHNCTDIFQNIENSFLRNYLAVFMGCVTLNLVQMDKNMVKIYGKLKSKNKETFFYYTVFDAFFEIVC